MHVQLGEASEPSGANALSMHSVRARIARADPASPVIHSLDESTNRL